MEVAKLVLDYFRVLVWPITTIGLALLFRVEIRNLLARLRKALLPGGVSLELEDQIQQVRLLSERVASEPAPSNRKKTPGIPLTEANARMIQLGLQPTLSGLDMSYYRNLAATDPVLSLAGIRIELETLARNLARGYQLHLSQTEPINRVLVALRDAFAITPGQMELAQKALRLCNQAIHGRNISREQAEEVIDAVSVLARDYLAWLSWGFSDGWKPIEPAGEKG
jgi:hypothetical protein